MVNVWQRDRCRGTGMCALPSVEAGSVVYGPARGGRGVVGITPMVPAARYPPVPVPLRSTLRHGITTASPSPAIAGSERNKDVKAIPDSERVEHRSLAGAGEENAVHDRLDGVRDQWLWAQGRGMDRVHRPDPADARRCVQRRCVGGYPCLGRRLADRAVTASWQGWPLSWTVRHDIRSCGAVGRGGTWPVEAARRFDVVSGRVA